MIYSSWDIECGDVLEIFCACVSNPTIIWVTASEIQIETVTFLSFWATFCPFTALTTPKIELLKKMKKKKNTRRYHHFTLGHHKLWSYYVWFLRYGAWQTKFFLMFWSFFALLPQENQNFEMMKEVSGDIIISHMCTKNYDQIMFNTWDMVHDKQTDRWTDWLMEKVTQKGGCPT